MMTAADAIEYLLSTTGGGAQDQEHRALRQALFHAYRDLVSVREWRWYHAVDSITLQAGTPITKYTLPWGCQSVDSIWLAEPAMAAQYVTPVEWERIVRSELTAFASLIWTVLPSETQLDRYDCQILNGHQYAQACTLTYRRRPRDLRCTGWERDNRTGTLHWNGTTATGTGTNWSNQVLGCVLRVSGDDKKAPESLAGMTPYRDEGLISQVVSSTELHTWTPVGSVAYTNTRFVVTDYLDISPGMYTALLSGAEMWLARLMGKNVEGPAGVYGRDLRMAFESDAVAPLSGRRDATGGYYDFWHLRAGVDQPCPTYGFGGPNASGTCPIQPPLTGGTASTHFDACGQPSGGIHKHVGP